MRTSRQSFLTQSYSDEEYLHNLATCDREYLWHPFTQMFEYDREEPLIIAEGKGSYLIDVHGNRYLDGVSSLWVTVHGHQHPVITGAIIDQVQKIAHTTLLGPSNIPAIHLAERLVQISPPGLAKVFYSECGSAAVEIGLKIAFQYWQQRSDPRPQKTTFAFLENSYHGDTLGAVSVGGIELFHKIYRPLLTEHIRVPSPYCYHCALSLEPKTCKKECFDEMERAIAAHHEKLAAFIVEPLVQGAAGMIVFPDGYLRRAREVCDRYEVLLIADEVATGFGRTGRMFACEHEGVSPDIMTMGKGITGGYLPLAATLATNEVYCAFLGEYHKQKTFFHGHTYTGNPVACAAALASLDVFEQENTLGCLQGKIMVLSQLLHSLEELKHVGEVRQKGFMVGIELVRDRTTKEPYPVEANVGRRVIREARKNGLAIRPLGDVIVLMPPLSITESELRRALEITFAAIHTVTEREA
ncbi:MAG TPA: adenosylmethionine--8-amino-7-oxononanoate transaminase [Thermodesulfobacteriota bacterium]|nr:adenosylmethionine--8-amino-7-oxononanoate transaminase [Deltaproteobacteria bacterium]HNR11998.1 adenosylmethionine--8-amino-7-oxononanoate transaminase [Thermodesulfobacteriota bacterium]HNU72739.1 adenosylmethionine--8-amino-7-oxononanoate transaminase [Thermodesulfobacteriota bacterium]HOC38625.1 adenosylmethionine--8-amino-7-oxononanoate transaminase [Thermodesulfobacteriota bacterium]